MSPARAHLPGIHGPVTRQRYQQQGYSPLQWSRRWGHALTELPTGGFTVHGNPVYGAPASSSGSPATGLIPRQLFTGTPTQQPGSSRPRTFSGAPAAAEVPRQLFTSALTPRPGSRQPAAATDSNMDYSFEGLSKPESQSLQGVKLQVYIKQLLRDLVVTRRAPGGTDLELELALLFTAISEYGRIGACLQKHLSAQLRSLGLDEEGYPLSGGIGLVPGTPQQAAPAHLLHQQAVTAALKAVAAELGAMTDKELASLQSMRQGEATEAEPHVAPDEGVTEWHRRLALAAGTAGEHTMLKEAQVVDLFINGLLPALRQPLQQARRLLPSGEDTLIWALQLAENGERQQNRANASVAAAAVQLQAHLQAASDAGVSSAALGSDSSLWPPADQQLAQQLHRLQLQPGQLQPGEEGPCSFCLSIGNTRAAAGHTMAQCRQAERAARLYIAEMGYGDWQ